MFMRCAAQVRNLGLSQVLSTKNLLSECASLQHDIAKNLLRSSILKIQSGLRLSMFVPRKAHRQCLLRSATSLHLSATVVMRD